ncbi:Na+/H+ antiporter subunit E [Saccharomonospora viridis]|jgi:multicomponent Na+:H+ antiporter subunit E|uniref:Multisubunit Na+/H+ antiporter, MnhE subunit n=2 Tax=Saccharomonospora viridis TaxID=1852 RepID=C7MQX2_SACVD|nr:Na+/H+ antiporter subunit E [Saccharomonospora viridis]ACU96518.1 multisubunit Na+/H+ antiporter, MnhE subunit [Saccharomonospora viridis DSM 43017]KHF42660.1 sodium:proton antiporter [Saccharomonospora viridis]SFO94499.1 multisubunit sodium/proton antiporter, MrpE subunit [Saccharomonospora viridis]
MRRYSPLLALWLLVVWLLLWRSVEPLVLVSGVVVALAILSLFPFQPVRSPLFTRPHRVLGLVLYLAWDLFSSGVRVGWDAARFGPRTKAVIVEAPILVDRDFLVATAANMISLSPGVFVLQINRPQNCFYVYVLGVRSAAVDEHVRHALNMQMRAIKTFGTAEEIRAAEEGMRKFDGARSPAENGA